MMRQNIPSVRVVLLTGCLICACSWIGCGQGNPTGSISGKVTHNGEPLTTGVVMFLDSDAGIGASAELDADGVYEVLSLPTGQYQVAIQAPPAPSPEEVASGAQLEKLEIPDKYLDPQTSGLSANIRKGNNSADFSL